MRQEAMCCLKMDRKMGYGRQRQTGQTGQAKAPVILTRAGCHISIANTFGQADFVAPVARNQCSP